MELTIDIPDRVYSNLKLFCEANGIEIAAYALTALEERLSVDRFGDMNEMLKKPEPKKRVTRKKAEPKPEAKKVEEEKKEEPTPVDVVEPPKVEADEPVVVEKPKKRRSLKVK